MKIISTGAADILLVDLPDELKHYSLAIKADSECKEQILLAYSTMDKAFNPEYCQVLPEGYNYTILWRAKELTDVAWQILIPNYGGKIFDYDPKHYNSYPDYEFANHPFESKFFDTATESGHSFLKSQGILLENPLKEPRITEYKLEEWINGGSEVYEERTKAYWLYQSKVKNPLVIKAEKI